ALMKAINPALTSDQVAQIIVDTAQPGTGDVTRSIDALAAVRRAAEAVPAVTDRFEGMGVIELGNVQSQTEANLNLYAGDSDIFRFNADRASEVEITLAYAKDLAPVRIHNFL